jgi:hypothetical protein
MTAIRKDDFFHKFEALKPSDQARVIQLVDSLQSKKWMSGEDLIKFAGTISHEDAEAMRRAISEPVGVTKEQLLSAPGRWSVEDAVEIQRIIDAEFGQIDPNELQSAPDQ